MNRNYFMEKLLESIDASREKLKVEKLQGKFKDLVTVDSEPIKSLSAAERMVYKIIKG